MKRIEADSLTLLKQAPMTVEEYLDAAVRDLDGRFGEGYAKANPGLVGAYIHACALDFGAAVIAGAIEEASGSLP